LSIPTAAISKPISSDTNALSTLFEAMKIAQVARRRFRRVMAEPNLHRSNWLDELEM